MNLFRKISESYKRRRHTHGFGVHSPHAFRLLGDMRCRRGYAYYADTEIENMCKQLHIPHSALRGRLLHRLVARHGFRKICVTSDLPKPYRHAMSLTDSSAVLSIAPEGIKDSDLIVSCGDLSSVYGLRNLLLSGTVVIIFSEKVAPVVARKIGEYPGLMLLGKSFLYMEYREGMRFTSYTVRL